MPAHGDDRRVIDGALEEIHRVVQGALASSARRVRAASGSPPAGTGSATTGMSGSRTAVPEVPTPVPANERGAVPPMDPPAAGRVEESFADVYNGALRLLSDGRLDEALHALSRAIDLDPTLGVAHYNRGLAHYLKEAGRLSPDPQAELRLAIQDFDRALELGISDALLFRNRGNAYSRKGDVTSALTDYARAIALEPSNPLAYLNRAEVYENTLQKERAIADYKAVLDLDTDEQWHDQARARLRALGVATRSRRR